MGTAEQRGGEMKSSEGSKTQHDFVEEHGRFIVYTLHTCPQLK